jgi:hypothetical protein
VSSTQTSVIDQSGYYATTHIYVGQRRKSQTFTVLENRSTCAVQVDIHIPRSMHAELLACGDDYAVLDVGDVYGAGHLSTNDERVLDVL